ncbi:MAG: F0F1 ATP synthase subunit B [Faecousia sp.]
MTVNPVTLIAQICNLFIQLLIVKIFFLDKIKAVLDKRREAADKQIADAEAARSEAAAIKQTYEENMRQAKAKADDMILSAQKTAAQRGDEIISQAQKQAAQLKSKAASDIELEKKKAINDAKDEISGLAMAIAGKVVERELNTADQAGLIDRFIEELGDQA